MIKYLQRLGKSLMLPVAALPVAGILMGIGYWIDPQAWGSGNIIAAFCLKAGGALIDNMALLFAIGVAVGMAKDKEGTSALAGLVSFLVFTTVLSTASVTVYYKALGLDPTTVPVAFAKIATQFIGIISGLIGGHTYNAFKDTRLPKWLAFFSGRRSVAIMTALITLVCCIPLFFIWPAVYNALVNFGQAIIGLEGVGAGIYAFFNRLLIPVGLHHALNSVFWFDIAGISDIARFWGSGAKVLPLSEVMINTLGGGQVSATGIYMTGFFPIMMFGLPAAALAFVVTAKPEKRKMVIGLCASAALCSFFTGVTEPLEFAFMFLAPVLYLVHALLTGIFVALCAYLPVRAGFQFSAGFVDWFLSFKAPGAKNGLLLLLIGVVAFVVYFVVFTVLIKTLNLKTPGREDNTEAEEADDSHFDKDYQKMAQEIFAALGGRENIVSIDNCITRLRLELVDDNLVDEKRIRDLHVSGLLKPGKNALQVIIGPDVQFVADALHKIAGM